MAADGRLGANHHDFASLAGGRGAFGSRFDYPHHWNLRRVLDVFEGQRRCSVARDDQHLRAMLLQVLSCAHSIAADGLGRFRSVGKASRIAEVEVVSVQYEADQFLENGQSAEAGIEDSNDG